MNADFLFSSQHGGAPRGLANIGGYTCYINASLQSLFSCDIWSDFLCGDRPKTLLSSKSKSQGLVCQGLQDIFNALKEKGNDAIVPDTFLGVISCCWSAFVPGRQMDAAEFTSFLLAALHDELLVKPEEPVVSLTEDPAINAVTVWEKSSQSPVSHVFHVQVIGLSLCSRCHYASGQYRDVNNCISIELPSDETVSLQDCLVRYFSEEELEDAKCNGCSSMGIKHRLILGRLPPVLIIHLKRFKQSPNGTLQKINKIVHFTSSLDLNDFCLESVHSNTKYNLVSVINHHGHSLTSGHYTTISRRGDRWYIFNDSKVSSCTSRHLCTSNAYLLVFEKEIDNNNNNLNVPFDQQGIDAFLNTFEAPTLTLNVAQVDQLADKLDVSLDFFCEEDGELPPNFNDPIFASGDAFDLEPTPDSDSDFNCSDLNPPNFNPPDSNRVGNGSVTQLADKLDVSLDLFCEEDGELPPNFNDPIFASGDAFDLEPTPDSNSDFNCSDLNPPNFNPPDSNRVGNGSVTNLPHTSQPDVVISQCNHPNFDLDVLDPTLTEDDVPGAHLNLDCLSQYTKDQLQWWLACRGLVQGGKKAELIQRILNHRHRAGNIYPGVGKGKWYEAKRKKKIAEAYDSNKRYPMVPTGAVWKPFPSVHIPNKYSTEMAMQYLRAIPSWRFSLDNGVTVVNKEKEHSDSEDENDLFDLSLPTQDDRKNLFVNGTMRRATNFLDSGRVLSVHDCEKDKHYCVKAEVQASMRKQIYAVIIMISKAQGTICFAECCCKARALGRCCHIFAVLLLVSRHIALHGNEAVTSTGRTCYWLLPGTSVVRTPGAIRDKVEYYPTFKYKRRCEFDPRPRLFQSDDPADRIRRLLEPLSELAVSTLWKYHLSPTQQSTPLDEQFPDDVTTSNLADMCSYLLWNLNLIKNVSMYEPLHFPLTRSQSSSTFWKCERSIRISASQAKHFLGLESSRSTVSGKINALRRHVWGLNQFQSQAMAEGSEMEPNARRAYCTKIKEENPEFDVIETGLWVNPKHPQLSCSPDGIIVDTNGFFKLLEIKCPAVLKGMDPAHFETLPKNQLRSFCLERDTSTGKIELKRSHQYYYQVQMSLDILQLEHCDFVLYSELPAQPSRQKTSKMLTVTVNYDESFWREKRERLKKIHRELIVPEYFLYNSVYKRPPTFLVFSPFHEDHNDDYFWHGEEPQQLFTVQTETELLAGFEYDNDTFDENSLTVHMSSEILID